MPEFVVMHISAFTVLFFGLILFGASITFSVVSEHLSHFAKCKKCGEITKNIRSHGKTHDIFIPELLNKKRAKIEMKYFDEV